MPCIWHGSLFAITPSIGARVGLGGPQLFPMKHLVTLSEETMGNIQVECVKDLRKQDSSVILVPLLEHFWGHPYTHTPVTTPLDIKGLSGKLH